MIATFVVIGFFIELKDRFATSILLILLLVNLQKSNNKKLLIPKVSLLVLVFLAFGLKAYKHSSAKKKYYQSLTKQEKVIKQYLAQNDRRLLNFYGSLEFERIGLFEQSKKIPGYLEKFDFSEWLAGAPNNKFTTYKQLTSTHALFIRKMYRPYLKYFEESLWHNHKIKAKPKLKISEYGYEIYEFEIVEETKREELPL